MSDVEKPDVAHSDPTVERIVNYILNTGEPETKDNIVITQVKCRHINSDDFTTFDLILDMEFPRVPKDPNQEHIVIDSFVEQSDK